MRALMAGLVAAACVAACVSPGPARAQMDSREGIALQNQILELRRDLQAMQGRGGASLPPPVARGGGGSGGGEIAGQLLDRVQALEEQNRQLRGQIDQLANAQRRQGEELAKQIGDLSFRQGNGGPAAAVTPSAPVAAPAPVPLNAQVAPQGRRPPELAMQEGNAALARRDYPMAEAAAREVLAGGRGPRATDAQFLLAQSLAGRRDYQGAAIAYDDAYNRGRTGARGPDALLGVASSMAALNEAAAACASLDKLRAEYPGVRPDVRQSAAALRTRAGCR